MPGLAASPSLGTMVIIFLLVTFPNFTSSDVSIVALNNAYASCLAALAK